MSAPTTDLNPMVNATPGAQLRSLLQSNELFFLMEAHDGLSARIADDAGFPAVWASGLSISTALGLRDSNEASWSQVLSVVERIVEASSVPVVVDGDTGHGDFNSARRFARQASMIGTAAVCFEDKIFPKMNSFVGDNHPLADCNEFCGMLMACREAVRDDTFCLVARTEALIAGYSMDEALERAHRYVDAGADAIFIHSRQKTVAQIEEFARCWGNRHPLIIAPTTYADTPADTFRRIGISGVIWANHNMRAAFTAMRTVCADLRRQETVQLVEGRIASLAEVFQLMRYEELAEDERRFRIDLEPSP
jgi:phosphoenolpyruvate phosphomutase